MRKVLLMCSTVVFGLMSVTSASAGFIAGANTRVALIATNYTGGLVNQFAGFSPGVDRLVTTPGSFPANPTSAYSKALSAQVGGLHNVYLVTGTSNSNPAPFSVTFTDGEQTRGVAASNGSGGLLANNWGSHISLQSAVQTALTGFFGAGAATAIANATTGAFGSGGNAIDIQNGSTDTIYMTDTSVYGSVNSNFFQGVVGLNDMALVFTVVPEPTSLGLFGIGTLVFGLARSRRKKS